MAKNKDNQAKKGKKSKSIDQSGANVIDNVGAVSATEMTGAMANNQNAGGAANINDLVNYKPKAKGKNK